MARVRFSAFARAALAALLVLGTDIAAAAAAPAAQQHPVILQASNDRSQLSAGLSVTAAGKYAKYELASIPGYAMRSKSLSLCDKGVKQSAGYFDVGEKHFFFWYQLLILAFILLTRYGRFFESRSDPANDPLVLWLNGGPGCSSLTGLFMELGPCTVSKAGNDTPYNENSWNSNANIIFLDQPTNVGFSYSDNPKEDVSNTVDAASDVYNFLQLFLKANPKFADSEFHVTGESYAGHYIPAIASAILTGNIDAGAPDNDDDLLIINLVSVAIDGPVLEQAECDAIASKYGTCKSLIEGCYRYQSAFTCVPGAIYCNNAMIGPFQKTGLNIYDIRQKCDPSNPLCYSILGDIEAYLNRPDVQDALGVDVEYKGCNMEVNQRFMMAGDWMRPYVNLVSEIINDGVKVLIYAGDADYICNYMGNRAWTLELEWAGKEGFNDAPELSWVSKVTGKKAGSFRTYGELTYLTVFEAGHMVPYDQPEHSKEFINEWIFGGKGKAFEL
ncbi:hypothetical protein HDU82_005288 [Entophlyctis luteolus]|nr:hypothetical protein HDU82_005283 [Entophlyctis luteolus]KAJ3211666.1 hypothetical protein HDU82_005288 [Entophlyctis luteolus]